MRTIRAWLIRGLGLFRTGRRARQLAAEIESHFELHVDDNIRAGMSAQEARRAALLTFGSIQAAKEDYRDQSGVPLLEHVLQDLRYASRRLRRQPGFALLIILTLALGVGANAAIFGLVDALMFWKPAHVREPERLLGVTNVSTYVKYEALRSKLSSVEFAAYTNVLPLTMGAGEHALPLRSGCVTPTFFRVLGAPPSASRRFEPSSRIGTLLRGFLVSSSRIEQVRPDEVFWKSAFERSPLRGRDARCGSTATLNCRKHSSRRSERAVSSSSLAPACRRGRPRPAQQPVFLSCACSWAFCRFWLFERIRPKSLNPLRLLALAQKPAAFESRSVRQPSLTVGLPLTSGELRLASQVQAKAVPPKRWEERHPPDRRAGGPIPLTQPLNLLKKNSVSRIRLKRIA